MSVIQELTMSIKALQARLGTDHPPSEYKTLQSRLSILCQERRKLRSREAKRRAARIAKYKENPAINRVKR